MKYYYPLKKLFLAFFIMTCYNTSKPPETTYLHSLRWFITADKILISIRRIAMIIWTIKIIRKTGVNNL